MRPSMARNRFHVVNSERYAMHLRSQYDEIVPNLIRHQQSSIGKIVWEIIAIGMIVTMRLFNLPEHDLVHLRLNVIYAKYLR